MATEINWDCFHYVPLLYYCPTSPHLHSSDTHRMMDDVNDEMLWSIWTSPTSSVCAVTLRWIRNGFGGTTISGVVLFFFLSSSTVAGDGVFAEPIGGKVVNFFMSPSDLVRRLMDSEMLFFFCFFCFSSKTSFSVMVNVCFRSSCDWHHSWSLRLYSSVNVSSVTWKRKLRATSGLLRYSSDAYIVSVTLRIETPAFRPQLHSLPHTGYPYHVMLESLRSKMISANGQSYKNS